MEHRSMHELVSHSQNGLPIYIFKDGLKMKFTIPSHNKIIAFVYEFIDTPSYLDRKNPGSFVVDKCG